VLSPSQVTQQIAYVLAGLCWGSAGARPLTPPGLALGGGGTVTAGAHKVAITYVRASGESAVGGVSAPVTFDGAHAASVVVHDVPQGVTSVNVYMTIAGGSVFYLAANVAGAGTFSVDVTDAALVMNQQAPATEPVFARVAVCANEAEFGIIDSAFPLALVIPEAEEDPAEHSDDLVDEARFTVLIFAANANDQAGGAALVGANRLGVGTSSVGRGVMDLEPMVQAALLSTSAALGGRPRVKSKKAPTSSKARGVMAGRQLDVLVTRLPASPTFDSVRQLAGAGGAGHTVNLSWALPADRWDLVGVVVRRGTSGGSPPASPTAGTGVPVSGLPTSVVDAPGAGTWPYSVWLAYDSTRNPVDGTRDVSLPVTDYSGFQVAGAPFVTVPQTLAGVSA
jgi:hypothetical protein